LRKLLAMTSALALVGALWSEAIASTTPEKAMVAIAQFCVDTGAKTDNLEALLHQLHLASSQNTAGTHIFSTLQLDRYLKLEIGAVRGGDVVMCTMEALLADAESTFDLLKHTASACGAASMIIAGTCGRLSPSYRHPVLRLSQPLVCLPIGETGLVTGRVFC
jgi:hypothetical protein